jgi:hypothetical protein
MDHPSIARMAYYKLHDTARARSEVAMARKSVNQTGTDSDHHPLDEAEAIIGK